MSINFRYLFSLGATHAYYGKDAPCRELEYLVPAATRDILGGARMLARQQNGRLYLLYEADADKTPMVDMAGTTLIFGLRPHNPAFDSFTEPPTGHADQIPLYTNLTQPAQLDAATAVTLAGATHALIPDNPARPLQLTLRTHDGDAISHHALGEGQQQVMLDLHALGQGLFQLEEQAGNSPAQTRPLCVAPELAGENAWAVLALRIDASHYTVAPDSYATAPAYTIALQARSIQLQYCIVAPENYPLNDFDQLAITDAGFTEQGRDQALFQKASPNEDDAKTLRLISGDPKSRLILFRSQATLKRHARGFRKLRLVRNGSVLIEHLPQPPERLELSQMIVHLSKT